MKVYIKELRILRGKPFPKGWHEVNEKTAQEMLRRFRNVCRLPGRAYGEGWREPEQPEA